LFRLELPHSRRDFLLVLPFIRIMLGLHSLLGLEAGHLLRIRSRWAHGQRALRSSSLIATYQAGNIRETNQCDDDDQGDKDRHSLTHRWFGFWLFRHSSRRVLIEFRHS
jgi:hypothetical protein